MGEFDVISRYFRRPIAFTNANTQIGIGDDCALLTIPHNKQLVVSIDTLVSGRHFPLNALPEDIASRAFCVCLSDLAAMGAKPEWFTLALTLPELDNTWLAAFSDSLFNIADQYQCELVGGDTTQGPLTISLQVHGTVDVGGALTRAAAQVGDLVYVTNTLGDGAAALACLLGEVDFHPVHADYLKARFYCPIPQIKAGRALANIAHAAIDISDGLLADLAHIARASGVDIIVDVDQLPLSEACKTLAQEQAWQWALTGGDDYQLAFTVPVSKMSLVDQMVQNGQLQATVVGQVVARDAGEVNPQCAQSVVHCHLNNKPWQGAPINKGFEHFAP